MVITIEQLREVRNVAQAALAEAEEAGDIETGKVAGLMGNMFICAEAVCERIDRLIELGEGGERIRLRYHADEALRPCASAENDAERKRILDAAFAEDVETWNPPKQTPIQRPSASVEPTEGGSVCESPMGFVEMDGITMPLGLWQDIRERLLAAERKPPPPPPGVPPNRIVKIPLIGRRRESAVNPP